MAQPTEKNTNSAEPGRRVGRWRAASAAVLALLALLLLLGLSACESHSEAYVLAEKARALWDGGRYQDAARNFVTLAELDPDSPLAEQALFWAGSLYQHYLHDDEQAARTYLQLTVNYPDGQYFYDAKLSLAEVYGDARDTRHRALQIYQQLLLADDMRDKRDWLHFKIGLLNMQMSKMDQARMEMRDLLVESPQSALRPQAYYLVGYTYYLEQRYALALYVFRQTAKDFAGTPIALRAEFFVADTLEEQGQMREALKAYGTLRGKYPNPEIVDMRIKTLQARIRRGVR